MPHRRSYPDPPQHAFGTARRIGFQIDPGSLMVLDVADLTTLSKNVAFDVIGHAPAPANWGGMFLNYG